MSADISDTRQPKEHEPLHVALTVPEVAETWRPRGQYIPAAGWERFLVEGAAFNAVIRSRDGGDLVGLVELRDVDPIDGYGYVSAAAAVPYIGSGLIVEAVAVFLDEVFARTQLHKAYMLLSESSRAALASALGDVLEIEGILKEHVWLLGRRQDVTVTSVSRERLPVVISRSPALARVGGPDGWRLVPEPAADVATITDILARATGLDPSMIDPDLPIADLGLDSLAVLEVVTAIEEALGHEVPDDLLASIETVRHLLGWVGSPV